MTPIDFILFLLVFLAVFMVIPYLGHLFVAYMKRTDFFPWMRRRSMLRSKDWRRL